MRRLRYNVAASLDGYIGPHNGSIAWITPDSTIDFDPLYSEFDLFIMGRKTYEVLKHMGDENPLRGQSAESILVVSKTLAPEQHPEVTIIRDDFLSQIQRAKEEEGKDIWLFGGGELLGACLDAKLVDTIEVAIMPTLLRGGVKMVSDGGGTSEIGQKLEMMTVRKLDESGILMCVYRVNYAAQ